MSSSPTHAAGFEGRGEKSLSDLLAIYARYASLVRYQEAALENDDLERFEDLARARKAIQDELEAGPTPFPPEEPLDASRRELLDQVHEQLREALARDMRLRVKLEEMRNQAREQVHTVEGRGKPLDGYLSGEKASASHRRNRLNVRL